MPAPFQLNATVVDHHDGDTFYVDVDWGKRRIDRRQPVRVIGLTTGIAARELRDPGGPEAAAHLATELPAGTRVVLRTVKDDKYSPRWDCQVTYLLAGVPTDLATVLVARDWAVPWNGKGTQPKPPWPRPGHPATTEVA